MEAWPMSDHPPDVTGRFQDVNQASFFSSLSLSLSVILSSIQTQQAQGHSKCVRLSREEVGT